MEILSIHTEGGNASRASQASELKHRESWGSHVPFLNRLRHLQLLSRFILRNHVFSFETDRKCVAFTFDDAPNEKSTCALVDLFVSHNGKASFFCQGDKSEHYPEGVRYAAEHHFTIANHSYDHPRYTNLSSEEMLQQIERTNAILQNITKQRPTMLRPPYHAISQWQALRVRLRLNQTIIGCNLAPTDWSLSSSEELADFLTNSVVPGAIVCLHDGYETTLNALIKALPVLRNKGFEFLSLEEMLQTGSPSPYRYTNINNLHS